MSVSGLITHRHFAPTPARWPRASLRPRRSGSASGGIRRRAASPRADRSRGWPDRERQLAADDRTQRFEIEPAARRRRGAARAVPRGAVAAKSIASCSASRSRSIADARDPPSDAAPASPSAANIATGALTTLAGTCAPGQIEHRALADAGRGPVPPGTTTARVIPSTRVTGMAVDSPIETRRRR